MRFPRTCVCAPSASATIAVLLCSSGSSGQVKIVPHTLRALFDHAQAVCAHLSVTWRDSWIACLPFYHIGGLTLPFRCFVSGATLVISRSAPIRRHQPPD